MIFKPLVRIIKKTIVLGKGMHDLYELIVETQEKTDAASRSYGLWPSFIEMPEQPNILLGIDYNILLALQIMLMLLEVSKKVALPRFDQVKNRFDTALAHFISDTKRSQRIPGFIAYWPYIQFSDNEWKHNFDPNNSYFNHIDIKNDIGDSALAAIYLMKTQQKIEHVIDYGQILSCKSYENAFYAFLPALNFPGGVDVVDTLNILASIQMLKSNHPHLLTDQLLTNEKNAIDRTKKILKSDSVLKNMKYFRRASQFLVAFSRFKTFGFTIFDETDCNAVRQVLINEMQKKSLLNLTEQSELMLSYKLLRPNKNQKEIARMQNEMNEDLKRKLLQPICQMDRNLLGDYTSFIAGSGFAHTIIYNKLVCWYSPAHAAASVLSYLSLR